MRAGSSASTACGRAWVRALGAAGFSALLAMNGAVAWAQAPVAATPALVPALQIVGDGIPVPLSPEPGDAQRGWAIVGSRQQGMCLLCHSGPAEAFASERTPGNVAGSLAGAGSRWSAAQLRLRVADARALNPASVMPAYHRTQGLSQVAGAHGGRPLLSAQQVEDVVAFLQTLR